MSVPIAYRLNRIQSLNDRIVHILNTQLKLLRAAVLKIVYGRTESLFRPQDAIVKPR
jgi:hypothetical protein